MRNEILWETRFYVKQLYFQWFDCKKPQYVDWLPLRHNHKLVLARL